MDPNTLLFELRAAVEEFTRTHDAVDVDPGTHRVLHAWSDLDEWISRGGFLPSVWSEAQRHALENTRSAGVTWAGVAPPAQSTAPTGAYDDPAVQRAIHEYLHTNPWAM